LPLEVAAAEEAAVLPVVELLLLQLPLRLSPRKKRLRHQLLICSVAVVAAEVITKPTLI
jgi:hypothetical protein